MGSWHGLPGGSSHHWRGAGGKLLTAAVVPLSWAPGSGHGSSAQIVRTTVGASSLLPVLRLRGWQAGMMGTDCKAQVPALPAAHPGSRGACPSVSLSPAGARASRVHTCTLPPPHTRGEVPVGGLPLPLPRNTGTNLCLLPVPRHPHHPGHGHPLAPPPPQHRHSPTPTSQGATPGTKFLQLQLDSLAHPA